VFLPRLALDLDLPSYASCTVGITMFTTMPGLLVEMRYH
jgi:hypothetical protein